MNLYFIKCLMFTKNNNIKTKRRINRKINLCSYFLAMVLKSLRVLMKKKLVIKKVYSN